MTPRAFTLAPTGTSPTAMAVASGSVSSQIFAVAVKPMVASWPRNARTVLVPDLTLMVTVPAVASTAVTLPTS